LSTALSTVDLSVNMPIAKKICDLSAFCIGPRRECAGCCEACKKGSIAWIMRTGPKTLVFELQRKLNLTGVAICSIDLAKAGPEDCVRRKPHVHDVEHVEKLSPELQVGEFSSRSPSSDRRVFDQRKVIIVIGRPTKGIPSESAKAPTIWARSSRNVNRY